MRMGRSTNRLPAWFSVQALVFAIQLGCAPSPAAPHPGVVDVSAGPAASADDSAATSVRRNAAQCLPPTDLPPDPPGAPIEHERVKLLVQEFEDTMVRANKRRDDPRVTSVVDKAIGPLVNGYLWPKTPEKLRTEIIGALSDMQDSRARPAWIRALRDYRPGRTDMDTMYAAMGLAQSGVRDAVAMNALSAAFVRLEASAPGGASAWMGVRRAMEDISSPCWTDVLMKQLGRPMAMFTMKDRGNDAKIRGYRNEQFWQVVSAEILGNLQEPTAVRPLLKCVVDPNKADVAGTAVVAIIKIGQPAMPLLRSAVLGQDTELVSYASRFVPEPRREVVRGAAIVMGTLGLREGIEPLLGALRQTNASDEVTKAILARELCKAPASPQIRSAVLDVLRKLSPTAVIPPGYPATKTIAESLASLHDSTLVPELIALGNGLSGWAPDQKESLREALVATMIKVMTPRQMPVVENVIRTWMPGKNDGKLEKQAFAKGKTLLRRCQTRLPCYLAAISDPKLHDKKQQFAGIKAAYMLGVWGDEKTAAEVADRLPTIRNAAIKFAAGMTIDRLLPNGKKSVADRLQRMLETNKASGDRSLISADAPVRQVVLRLRARE